MIEYSHIKLSGRYDLLASGHTILCTAREHAAFDTGDAVRGRSSACAAAVLFCVRGLLALGRFVLAVVVGTAWFVCSEFLVPLLRELIYSIGGALVALVGWPVRGLGALLVDSGCAMMSGSRVLQAVRGLRSSARPSSRVDARQSGYMQSTRSSGLWIPQCREPELELLETRELEG